MNKDSYRYPSQRLRLVACLLVGAALALSAELAHAETCIVSSERDKYVPAPPSVTVSLGALDSPAPCTVVSAPTSLDAVFFTRVWSAVCDFCTFAPGFFLNIK